MIKVTTSDGIGHILESMAAIPDYSSSPNTCAALQAAYDAGDWVECPPPPPPPPLDLGLELEQQNWSDFRIALMMNETFRAWAATLPADWREDLKAAAILCNVEALQSTYSHLANLYPVSAAAMEEWQLIADKAKIPLSFSL